MLKQRSGAEQILGIEMQGGKSEEEARKVKIVSHRYTPEGQAVTGESSIGEILDESAALLELRGTCRKCPAALAEPFGCHGAIHYPVSARAEQWLIALAARSLEKKDPGEMMVKFVMENKFDGEPFIRLRQDPRFFELNKAPALVVAKGLLGKKTVSSDQLLQFILPKDGLEGSMMQVISFFSGGLKVQDTEPQEGTADMAISGKDAQGKEKWLVYDLPAAEQDDPSILQWKRFFKAVFRAHATNTKVIVDY